MDSVIRKIILFAVFLFPFIILTDTVQAMVFSKSLFVEGISLFIGVIWVIGRFLNNKEDTENISQKNMVFMVFGLYVFFTLISGIFGTIPELSFWGSLDHGTGTVFLFSLFIFSLIVSSTFKRIEDWHKLFTVFVVSGLFFNVGTFLSMAGVHFSKVYNLNALSGFLFGNSSWAGVYLSFVFFMGIGLMLASNTKFQKLAGFLGFTTAFLNPNLTGFIIQAPGAPFGFVGLARTASYSLIVGILLFALYLLFRKIRSLKWRKIFVGSFLSVVCIGIIFASTIGWSAVHKIVAEKAGPNRFVFWDIAVLGFKERPLLGWGGDSFQFVYTKYFNPIVLTPGYAPEFWVDRSHNIYFDEIISGGAIGFLLLMSLYGITLFGLARSAILFRDKEGLLYMALLSGVVSFLVQGLMIFQINTGWFIMAIIVAFTANFCFKDVGRTQIGIKKTSKNESIGNGFKIFLSALIGIVFFVLFHYLIFKPYKIAHGLEKFPDMPYEKRMAFYKELDSAYIGNTTDLGNIFLPYHIRLRRILQTGLEDREKRLMIEEIKEINRVLNNGLEKQEFRDLKLMMAISLFYSVSIALSDGEERQDYYDQSMFYIEKMKIVSPRNPASEAAKELLDVSFRYGEESLEFLGLDEDEISKE